MLIYDKVGHPNQDQFEEVVSKLQELDGGDKKVFELGKDCTTFEKIALILSKYIVTIKKNEL